MAYTNIDNYKRYREVLYSGGAKHRLRLWFGDVELENADNYCEKMTITSRIIPNGSKVLMLDNFVSKEVNLILHNIDLDMIQDPVTISLGTLVDGEYIDVPMGIFNLQDKPTTDKDKTTFTLRDNSVKFDFNYNAKELIDNNGGSATKLEILWDICEKAGVDCYIDDFYGAEDPIGIYDNTITARTYIAYLAEQAGQIPYIDRDGSLIFVGLGGYTPIIDMWYVEKYQNGDSFTVDRVVFESGLIKYESPSDDEYYDEDTGYINTLYLDSANPYITSQEQVDEIYYLCRNRRINSFTTGKVIGDPTIDPYDLVTFIDYDNDLTFQTLGTNVLTYNGVLTQTFDTQIGLEERKENVSLTPEETFRKWARTEIDNVKGEITQTTGRIDSIEAGDNSSLEEVLKKFDDYTPLNRTIEIERSVTQVQADTYTKTEINTKLTDGSVKKVLTTSVLIDENGQTIDKSGSKTKTNMDADGFRIYDKTGASDRTLFEAIYDEDTGQTVVRSNNITVSTYFTLGKHSRIEDYETGTGIFFIG